MEETPILFETVTTNIAKLIAVKREQGRITYNVVHPIVLNLKKIDYRFSLPQQQTAGAAILISSKVLLPECSTPEKLELIPLYEQAYDMITNFDKVYKFQWEHLRPIFHKYLDGIPRDEPGTKRILRFLLLTFDMIIVSTIVRKEFYELSNIVSPSHIIVKLLEIVNCPTRDLYNRKIALELLSRVIRKCPAENAPTMALIVGGVLSALNQTMNNGTVNSKLLEQSIVLFSDVLLLVFSDDAKKFDISKIKLSDYPENLHFIFRSHSKVSEKEAKEVIHTYIRSLLAYVMEHRVNNVKRLACQMVINIQTECGQYLGKSIYDCLLSLYTHLKHDDIEEFQLFATKCLKLIKDRNTAETFFYKELTELSRRLPLETYSMHGDREFRCLCSVLNGLGDAIRLMCTSGSETIELIIRAIADSVIVEKRGLMIISTSKPGYILTELRKYRLKFKLGHYSVKKVCDVLAELGGLEIISIVHNLMRSDSLQKRASYHILLAYLLLALEQDKKTEKDPDEPILLMLAEYLVEETNKTCLINVEKDSQKPMARVREHDWPTCIESLACINLALCLRFITKTSNRTEISLNTLCTILAQTSSPVWIVSEAADFALRSIAEHESDMETARDLISTYSSHILNSVSLACSSSENYQMAPVLLKSYLKYAEISDQFDQFRVIVEKMIYALDMNEQKSTIPILKALQTFMRSMNKQYVALKPLKAPESSEEPEKELPTAQHLIAEKILKRTKHMLTSKFVPVRLITLDILSEGMKLIRLFDDMLLPMIHQNFYGIMVITRERDTLSLLSVTNRVVEMAHYSGGFVHNKVLKEFWPEVDKYLGPLLKYTFHEHTTDYHLIHRIIMSIPKFVKSLSLKKEEIDETFMKFLDVAIEENRNFADISRTQKAEIDKILQENEQ